MAIRFTGAHVPSGVHVEVLPPNELPAGIAARPSTAPTELAARRPPPPEHRPFRDPALASAAGRKGALAKAAKAKQLRSLEGLGLRGAQPEKLEPFLRDALDFAEHEVARLAQTAGNGVCGSGPSSMVQSAALQLAASRFLFSLGEPSAMVSASRLADASRQNLAMAFELVAREAKARSAAGEESFEQVMKRINGVPVEAG